MPTSPISDRPIDFDEWGEHERKGVPGTWKLFAMRSLVQALAAGWRVEPLLGGGKVVIVDLSASAPG